MTLFPSSFSLTAIDLAVHTLTYTHTHTPTCETHIHTTHTILPCSLIQACPLLIDMNLHVEISHIITCARAHTHTQCLHVHLWQTFDICEGSIQRLFRPVTLGESLTSGKCQGVPSSSSPGMSYFSAFPSVLSLTFQPHPMKKTSHKGSLFSVAKFGYKATRLSLQEGMDCVDHTTCPDLGAAGPLVNWKRNNSGRQCISGQPQGHLCCTHSLPGIHNTFCLHPHTLDSQVHCVCGCVNTHCVSHVSACLPIIQMELLPAPEPFSKALVTKDHCEHICWNVRSRCGPMTMCS